MPWYGSHELRVSPTLTIIPPDRARSVLAASIRRRKPCVFKIVRRPQRALSTIAGRSIQAPRDADFALSYIKTHARSRVEQQACVAAVRFKCDVLWAQLDALNHAYVTPGVIPLGAFRPGEANE
jgi:hypothetical protein